MNTTRFIYELNRRTTKCVWENNLFCGGCAYASAIIAKKFEEASIPYEVIIYVRENRDINVIDNNDSCMHVAIRTKINSRYVYIGGIPNMNNFQIHNFGMVSSKKLMKYYKDVRAVFGWNSWYDVRYNATYSRICNSVYKKFTEI